jgi:hypothetical protein
MSDLFAAAEAAITDLQSKVAALEEGGTVDLAPILTDIEAIKQMQAAQAEELARLDARLDAISAAAGD